MTSTKKSILALFKPPLIIVLSAIFLLLIAELIDEKLAAQKTPYVFYTDMDLARKAHRDCLLKGHVVKIRDLPYGVEIACRRP